jgi:hypothetical protein
MILSLNGKMQVCILCNFILLIFITIFIISFSNKEILRIGYSKDLIVLGVTIDTLSKYILLHLLIFIFEFINTVSYEYANPIMYFNVFNDDKIYIKDFSKLELQFYSQSLWFMASLKNGLMILISISQIDITICRAVYYELAMILVIRNMLNEKIFINKNKRCNIYESDTLQDSLAIEQKIENGLKNNTNKNISDEKYIESFIINKINDK